MSLGDWVWETFNPTDAKLIQGKGKGEKEKKETENLLVSLKAPEVGRRSRPRRRAAFLTV
jgi:hypothetical protein